MGLVYADMDVIIDPRNKQDVLAKDNAQFKLGICTLQNEFIEYHHSLDASY
jgi:hypothetical protein